MRKRLIGLLLLLAGLVAVSAPAAAQHYSALGWTGSTSAACLTATPATCTAFSYNVLRSTVSGAEVQIASGITGTTYNDTTVVLGNTYYYVIQGRRLRGRSCLSAPIPTKSP